MFSPVYAISVDEGGEFASASRNPSLNWLCVGVVKCIENEMRLRQPFAFKFTLYYRSILL